MSKHRLLILALVAAVGGLVALEVRAQAKAAPAHAKRFEHACDTVTALPLDSTLDKRSADGWELVTTTMSNSAAGNTLYFCWKRPAK